MIEQFQHKLTNSFMLWFDNYLLTKGQAFTNTTGNFYNYTDTRIGSSYKAYGSPYKQWVADSSIAGANIPSGVYVGGSFSGRNDGVILDFDNGRALLETNSSSLSVTGSFAVKDFNIYYSNETEEDLIVENKYMVNSRIPSISQSYIDPYDQAVPAIFLSLASMDNRGFALGGLQETSVRGNAVVLAENPYQLDGVLSIFADSKDEAFNAIPMTGNPFNEYYDLKDGTYSYTDLKNQYSDGKPFYINDSTTSKLTDKARKSLANDLYVGFIDFDIQQHRYRHQ
jgi:hypothetical protein